MENGGNKKVVAIFEGKINFDTPKPDAFSDAQLRELFIRAKYEQRLYYNENSMAKADSKTRKGGLTLKASKADTVSSFDAFGVAEEQSVGHRRQQRRASLTMTVGSSNHQQRASSRNLHESPDEADEFGGNGDDDEWWEPFDATGSADDPFGYVQTHAADDKNWAGDGTGGGSVTNRRRVVGKADDMSESSKPRSRRAARRSSLGMVGSNHSGSMHSVSNHSMGDDISHASGSKSSRRLGGGRRKDPLSVSFHDEDDFFATGERCAPKRVASADDAAGMFGTGDKAAGRRRPGRRSSIGTYNSSNDHPDPKPEGPRSSRTLGSSRGDDRSAPRRSRSGQVKPHSLRNLPFGKGTKKVGDADETVTTVDSDDSLYSAEGDASAVKPKSSGHLLGALYGDGNGDGAASTSVATVQRRKPRRRGSCCL